MAMKRAQRGSALLITIVLSVALLSIVTAVWRSTFFMTDIARLRYRSYQVLYCAHAFLRLALTLYSHNPSTCNAKLTQTNLVILECTAWPLGAQETCHARAYASVQPGKVEVYAQI